MFELVVNLAFIQGELACKMSGARPDIQIVLEPTPLFRRESRDLRRQEGITRGQVVDTAHGVSLPRARRAALLGQGLDSGGV